MTTSIASLPPALLPLVLQHLPITTLLVVSRVSHAFNAGFRSKPTFLHTRLRLLSAFSPLLPDALTPDCLVTSLSPPTSSPFSTLPSPT